MSNIKEFFGIPCSPGVISGQYVFCKSSLKLHHGLIWVIDGPFTPKLAMDAINFSRALVTSYGGMTCHGANIVREFGLTAVAGVKNISQLSGYNEIEVDGVNGVVRVIK